MKFFIPHGKSEEEAESIREAVKKFTEDQLRWKVNERRIYALEWTHDGDHFQVKVGEKMDRSYGGEPVICILESAGTYLVCTPNRGFLRGLPILVGQSDAISVEEFAKASGSGWILC